MHRNVLNVSVLRSIDLGDIISNFDKKDRDDHSHN